MSRADETGPAPTCPAECAGGGQPPVLSRDRLFEIETLLQDLAVLVVSAGLTHFAREGLLALVPGLKPPVPWTTYAHLLLVYLPAWAIGAQRVELHRLRTLRGPLTDLLRALLAAQAAGTLMIALILVAAQTPLNRSLLALFLVISTFLLTQAKLLQRQAAERSRGAVRALLIGHHDDRAVSELARLRGRQTEALDETSRAALRERLRRGGIDEVVLGTNMAAPLQRDLLIECAEAGIPLLIEVERAEVPVLPPRVEAVGSALYLTYHRHEPDRPALVVKAVFDRLVALPLLVLTAPALVVIAVLVKLTSAGPILFVQARGGLYGRPFPMLKFRTMREGAEGERSQLLAANEMDGPVFKISRDPRITSLGRFLRGASLDELPQIVNVLAGHMSLVGPRPLPLVETEGLTGAHRRRLSMKPGITGLWQVSGRNELGFDAWMALDLEYVDRWSPALDLAILLRTLPALISRRGAV
jgi:exopolysaccharide biosynthesis polyprenyl glycosylphosphotransferase